MKNLISSRFLPPLLAAVFSLVWFWPSSTKMPGWGGDPIFILGVFEHLWGVISAGNFRLFSMLPIYWPLEESLWLSDPYTAPAILSWPLYVLTNNSVMTLCIFALMVQAANYFSMLLWLRRRMAGAHWGALLFCTSPWLQEHYAHYQNLFIFVIPLALWSVEKAFDSRSTCWIFISPFLVAWASAWNLYYQIFINILVMCVLGLKFTTKSLRTKVIGLGALILMFEYLFLRPYLNLNKILGTFSVGIGEVRSFSAHWYSFLGHAVQKSLIDRVGFYPSVEVGIEAVGFIGFSALTLWAMGLWRRKSYAIGALIAYGMSLGPAFLLYWLLYWIPGWASLRAIGRIQCVVVMLLIPVIVSNLLELLRTHKRLAVLLIMLLVFEWAPGSFPKSIEIQTDQATRKFLQELEPYQPVAVETANEIRFQREMIRASVFLSQGYSGRATLPAEIFRQFEKTSPGVDSWIKGARAILGAKSVVITRTAWIERLDRNPLAKKLGCYEIVGLKHCAFDISSIEKVTFLVLDPQAAEWGEDEDPEFDQVIFRASLGGYLALESIWGCTLEENYFLGRKHIFSRHRNIPGDAFFRGDSSDITRLFHVGDVVLDLKLRKPLPSAINFLKRKVEISCLQGQ